MESYERQIAERLTARKKLALALQVLQDKWPEPEVLDLDNVLVNDVDEWIFDAKVILETAATLYPDFVIDLYNDHIDFLQREYIDAFQKRDAFVARLKDEICKRLVE